MYMNLKPYILNNEQRYTHFTIGITSKTNLVDQKRNVVKILPGYKISIKVQPTVTEPSDDFIDLSREDRNCKLSTEIDDFR